MIGELLITKHFNEINWLCHWDYLCFNTNIFENQTAEYVLK
jgi:hypothetical protein